MSLWSRFLNARRRVGQPGQTPLGKNRHRLFFALCPGEATRLELLAAQQAFPRQLSEQWTRPANLHLALALSGGVEVKWLAALKRAGGAVEAPAFEVSLDRIAYWPHKLILCLTPSATPAPLQRLAADLDRSIEAAGLETARRAFRPYVALARESAYPPPEIQLEQPVVWKARSFALVESRPDGLGVAHEVVAEWPLVEASA